jgi:hypothetical protein
MKSGRLRDIAFGSVILACAACALAQDSVTTQPASTSVPRLVGFSGIVKDTQGKALSGQQSVTFSLFAEQEGGTALWSETQLVTADAQGHYAVYLGASNQAGLPLDIFSSGAARWLAIEAAGAAETARILLVGVPYALKAADADTLGGKPASAFMTVPTAVAQTDVLTAAVAVAPEPAVAVVSPAATTLTGSGTTNYLPLWSSSSTLGNSILSQNGGVVLVNGLLEFPTRGVATSSTGYASQSFDMFASAYSTSVNLPVNQHFRWEAEPVGNDTASPSGKVDLLFASGGGTTAETGFWIGSNGVINFAPGQTFPGTGAGTITGVSALTGLTGGGTSGMVALKVDTTKIPQLSTANAFTGNQSVAGNISATGAVSAPTISGGAGTFSTGVTAVGSTLGVSGSATGTSGETIGVKGTSASQHGVGVLGVLESSSQQGASFGFAGAWGDDGSPDGGLAVLGTSDNGTGGFFESNGFGPTLVATSNASGYALSAGGQTSSCSIDVSGNLLCDGSKSAVVPVDNGSRRVALYAVEAPENWFEDAGSGQLSGGTAVISFETTFAQTVNSGVDYHVFLTPAGNCKGLYVSNKTAQGFEVRELGGGQSSVAFEYRIMARRKGYESVRLADKTAEWKNNAQQLNRLKAGSKPGAAHASF